MRTLSIFIASCITFGIASAAELPFRVVTDANEINSLSQPSVIATPLNQTNFISGALVTNQKFTSATGTKTERGDNVSPASVYRAVWSAGADPNQHPYPPLAPTDFLYYEVNHDGVQAWATMSELGTPFLMVYADGQAHGTANASWSTRYVVPGTGARDVYVQFTVPAVRFDDRWEDATPAATWARMRMNVLVDAYPAWSTEALRFNDPNDIATVKPVRYETFGSGIGFAAGQTNKSSSSQRITLKLGTYAGGKALDIVLLFQAEAKVEAPCGDDNKETVCGGASVGIDWDPSAPQPMFYSKPIP